MRISEPALEGLLYLFAVGFLFLGTGRLERGGPGFEPGPTPRGALRVVTWNVGGADGTGGHAMDDGALPEIADTLRRLGPDLVVLQEIGSRAQLRRLVGELGDDDWSFVLGTGGGRRVAALCRGGRLESFWIGGAAVGVVLHLEGFSPLAAVGLHADAYSSTERNRTVGEAADRLLDRPESGGRVLAGDFNLDVDVDKRRDLFSDDAHLDVETYNYVATRLDDAARGRGSTAEPDRRLDYLFVDDRLRVIATGPWKRRRVGDMDHDPVVADVLPVR